MKAKISIVGESLSPNLGDRAIAQGLKLCLSKDYQVCVVALTRPAADSLTEAGIVSIANGRRLKSLMRIFPVKLRARVRWYLLGDRAREARVFSDALAGSSAIVIGGGQLIKNNVALFCERLALISCVARQIGVPYMLAGVGVDKKMGFYNWRVVRKTLRGARTIVVRDDISRVRVVGQCGGPSKCKLRPDFAFVLQTPRVAWSGRCDRLAINIMSAKILAGEGAGENSTSCSTLRDHLVHLVKEACVSCAIPVFFTTGCAEDLREALILRDRLLREAGISLEIFHPETLDELINFLSNHRRVLASRMHAGILAYTSGCNTLCINWDDKVIGVWSAIGESARVLELSDLSRADRTTFLTQAFAKVAAPSDRRLAEIAQNVISSFRAELELSLLPRISTRT